MADYTTSLDSGVASAQNAARAADAARIAAQAAAAGVGGGVTDHGLLTGLADDDHPQYAKTDGTRGAFAAPSHTHTASQVSDSTTVGRSVLTAADAAAARTAIGAGTSSLALGTSGTTAAVGNDSRFTDPQYDVNTVATSGSTQTLPATSAAHKVTLSANCTFTFTAPAKVGHTFLLYLSGAFTPTFPASVKWDGGAAPTYTTPAVYSFTTFDTGTTWLGSQVAKAIA